MATWLTRVPGMRLMTLAVLTSASLLAGCQTLKEAQTYHPPIRKYVELMGKDTWTQADKTAFVALFTIGGLNQLLQSVGSPTFEMFQQRRLAVRPWHGPVTEVLNTIKTDAEATAALPTPEGAVVNGVWQYKTGPAQDDVYARAQFILVAGLIHDVQFAPARRKMRPTLGSVLLGLVVGAYFVGFFFANAKKGGITFIVFLVAATWYVERAGGASGFFLVSEYITEPVQFTRSLRAVADPYPGPPTRPFGDGLRDTVVSQLNAFKPAPGSEDTVVARSFFERSVDEARRSDADAYRRAAASVVRSLMLNSDPTMVLDLAYYLSCLGQSGVNPELNFAIARELVEEARRSYATGATAEMVAGLATAVEAIHAFNIGTPATAESLRDAVRAEAGRAAARANTGRYERLLEAMYLLRTNDAEGLQLSDELIRRSPTTARYYNYKGLAAFATGDRELARSSFQRALALSPAYGAPRSNLDAIESGAAVEAGIGPAGQQRWNNEPEDFPLARAATFLDLFTPPDLVLTAAPDAKQAGIGVTAAAVPVDSIAAPLWTSGVAARWGLRSALWKRLAAFFVFMWLSLGVLTTVAFVQMRAHSAAGAVIFTALVLASALYVVAWGIDGLWSVVLLIVFAFFAIVGSIGNAQRIRDKT